jgi:hypothetical protein
MSQVVQATAENSLMSLSILTNTGAEESISVASSSTLQALQQELYRKMGIPRSHQRLFYLGRELSELDMTLESLGISSDHVLHLNMSSRDVHTAGANSCLQQLFIPSHSGVEASLGRYAESSWNDEEREKASRDVPEKLGKENAEIEHGPLEKGFWQQLFLPSYSGVEASLGRYAESSRSDEERAKAIEEIKAHAEKIAAEQLADPPLWYRLFVPSDSGVVATLGSYADPAMAENAIKSNTIGASMLPCESAVVPATGHEHKEGSQTTRLDSVSTQATAISV